MLLHIKQTIWSFQTLLLLLAFITLRGVSFFIAPYLVLQGILVAFLIPAFILLYFKNPKFAWYIVIGEIFLGGAGHFLELAGISLRTILLVVYTCLFTGEKMYKQFKNKNTTEEKPLLLPRTLYFLFGAFAIALLWAIINGMLQGNDLTLIIQDTIPFAFFALLLPFHELIREKDSQKFLLRLVSVFIFGSFLFSLFTFILFSSGTVLLQEPYYKWFRDIIGGKITDLENGFWRIVTPEHLLILPLTLLSGSLAMRKGKEYKFLFVPLLLCIFVLVLNLSRGYFLALFIGLFPLLYKHTFKKWFLVSTLIGLSLFVFFTGTYFVASHGKTLGLEVFGLRLQSFTSPKLEESTYTRSALVTPILQKIQSHPVLGSGLGSRVTFVNPVTKTTTQTNQFDWGYLELITEFGIVGALIYLFLLGATFYYLFKYIQTISLFPDFTVGILGGFVALLVANLTAPAIFHVFGIIYIVGVLGLILHTNALWEKLKVRLSKLFHHILSF